ncbi:hypothetical protein RRG08_011923 [Elysia crispata]|uniref:Uncharacterized protein n=1 Tax=Elysia crispata TaxID=231223 RepID=A0AAE0Y7V4_9GAST|nr:hypothetical protein RRG08_011923 [Elysia crispata]
MPASGSSLSAASRAEARSTLPNHCVDHPSPGKMADPSAGTGESGSYTRQDANTPTQKPCFHYSLTLDLTLTDIYSIPIRGNRLFSQIPSEEGQH